MAPKEKKLSPKQVLAALELRLAQALADKASETSRLLETNHRLSTELQDLKGLLVALQREKQLTHEVKERELKAELAELKAKFAHAERLSCHAVQDAAAVAALSSERLILLAQVQEAAVQRGEQARAHAVETAALQAQVGGIRFRLESAFADSLRTAVADEKRRLQLALDAEAQAALADVGQLRIQNAAQARQISQLLRVAEDRLREADAARADAGKADGKAQQAERKLAQQAPHAHAALLAQQAQLEKAERETREARAREEELRERLAAVVAEASSAMHLSGHGGSHAGLAVQALHAQQLAAASAAAGARAAPWQAHTHVHVPLQQLRPAARPSSAPAHAQPRLPGVGSGRAPYGGDSDSDGMEADPGASGTLLQALASDAARMLAAASASASASAAAAARAARAAQARARPSSAFARVGDSDAGADTEVADSKLVDHDDDYDGSGGGSGSDASAGVSPARASSTRPQSAAAASSGSRASGGARSAARPALPPIAEAAVPAPRGVRPASAAAAQSVGFGLSITRLHV